MSGLRRLLEAKADPTSKAGHLAEALHEAHSVAEELAIVEEEIEAEAPYLIYLVCLAAALATLYGVVQRTKRGTAADERAIVTREFRTFQRSYVGVYLLALGAEWMQNSHLYALLDARGFPTSQIAQAFAASFAASYAFGLLIESADQFGRRFNCALCFALFGASALSTFSGSFAVLLAGRTLAGMATALLHTAFDAWMVTEHAHQGFPDMWLAQTYGNVSFGTTLVSIAAGLVAEGAVLFAGMTGPFAASLLLSVAGLGAVAQTWKAENYGDPLSLAGLCDNMRRAAELVHRDVAVFYLVIVQACFEAVMYISLFMWTPVLRRSADAEPPYGVIFSLFMACVMVGAYVFQLVAAKYPVELVCQAVCGVAALAFLVLATAQSHFVLLTAFLVFEMCVGVYYPAIGTLRGKYVPEDMRTVVGQASKSLLSVTVLVLLLNFADMPSLVFILCAVLLSGGYWAQAQVRKLDLEEQAAFEREELLAGEAAA